MLSARACNAQHASDAASRAAMRERFERTVTFFFPIRVASERVAATVGWAKSLSVASPRGQTRHAILPTRDDRISRLCPPYDCCDAPRREAHCRRCGQRRIDAKSKPAPRCHEAGADFKRAIREGADAQLMLSVAVAARRSVIGRNTTLAPMWT